MVYRLMIQRWFVSMRVKPNLVSSMSSIVVKRMVFSEQVHEHGTHTRTFALHSFSSSVIFSMGLEQFSEMYSQGLSHQLKSKLNLEPSKRLEMFQHNEQHKMENAGVYTFFLIGLILILFFAVVFREPPRFE